MMFELRDGETLEASSPEDATHAAGVFAIPSPGSLGPCSDDHGGNAEAYKLTFAFKRSDGFWQWARLGAGSAFHLGEQLATAPREVWHYFKIGRSDK